MNDITILQGIPDKENWAEYYSMIVDMPKNNRLIVFFIPTQKLVNGGILSIFSICKESRKFNDIHKADVVLSTYPGNKSYKKNDLFENDETIYDFEELVNRGKPEFLQLHIPEYASGEVYEGLKAHHKYLKDIPDLRINIMNQNILYMPKATDVANWYTLTTKVTQTTAHNKYSTQQIANTYNLPTRHLSTFVDHHQYKWTPYENKKAIIALSNDVTEKREQIVAKLKKHLPSFTIKTIENMKFEEYKLFISSAKFTITFGEGFDGYYVEGFFTGGITLAVYNEDFFPDKKFSDFENTFKNYDDMLDNITDRIKALDNKASYEKVVTKNLDKINQLYSFSQYTENLRNFYLGKYSFVPKPGSAENLMGAVVTEKERLIKELIEQKEALAAEKDGIIKNKDIQIVEKDRIIEGMVNSRSWKLTKPLRKASAIAKKRA